MALEKKHIVYTAEDIQQYLSGKLAPAEMHAMEKAALDDAFLAEAIEGYEGMQTKDTEKELALLRDHFSKKQTAPVIPFNTVKRFHFWKAAAAVIVICSGIAISYLLSNNKSTSTANNSIATLTTNQDSIKSTVATAAPSINVAPATTTTPNASQQPLDGNTTQKDIANNNFIYRPGAAAKQDTIRISGGGYNDDNIKGRTDFTTNNNANASQLNNIEQAEKAGYNTNSQPAAPVVADVQKSQTAPDRKFVLQVLAPDGSPLPFANISIPDQKTGTYADAKGNARLVSSDSLLNIEIKSAGFITRNITLHSDIPQQKIMLNEDVNALKNQTQVAGKYTASNSKRRAALVPDSVINVEPADGWNNYDTYITNNLSVPDEIRQKKIHGEVEISFEVLSNGALSNMKIDKSLCDDCDEAALKVIKDGPRWKVKKGNKATGKIKVKF